MKLQLWVLALALAGSLSPGTARQNPVADLLRRSDAGAAAAERKSLEAKVEAHPSDSTAWMALASYSYLRDESEETVAILKRATDRFPRSPEFWRLLAEIHLSDAQSGPEWIKRPGVTRSRRAKASIDAAAFRTKSLESALAALEHVLDIDPYNGEAAERRVDALCGLERWQEAETRLSAMLASRSSSGLSAMRGFCLLKMGRTDAALGHVDAVLAGDHRSADLHFVRARILEAAGDSGGAAGEDAQGRFYGRLLPGTQIDYTADAAASLERMFGRKEGTSGMFSADRREDEIGAEIEVLAARRDEVSSELLAALAWSHYAHGPLEDRAFAILGDRHDTARLDRIYANAGSPCTLRGCLGQMVRLRLDGTYEKLCAHLPDDGGMFPIGVVQLLVELKDPRSAGPLIAYTGQKDAPFFEEALVALATFDSPATRKHLERWAADQDALPYAATALYAITREERWVKPVDQFVREADLYELWPIADALRRVDTPAAKAITAEYDSRQAAEKAKREKQRAEAARTTPPPSP